MEKTRGKRVVPSTLRKILAVDEYLTSVFVNTAERFVPVRQLKIHYKLLEISCHGIPWIACWLAFIWIINSKDLYRMQVNFLIGLIVDIIFVALLKALTRRRRPSAHNDPFVIGPDKYSFPSGHASRATFVVYFFLNLWPVNIICVPPLLAWSVSVCLSRILMRRHHLLDIVAGIILGTLEGMLVGFLYLAQGTCVYFITWLSDEKLDGGEYHV